LSLIIIKVVDSFIPFGNLRIAKEEENEDELVEKIEGIELEEKPDNSDENAAAEVTDEESDYQPIEFHLISDPDEKEALIKQLEKESAEEGGEEEQVESETVEEAAEEEEEKQPEEPEEVPVENPEENADAIEEVAETVAEPVEST
jgi:hypothetical protein